MSPNSPYQIPIPTSCTNAVAIFDCTKTYIKYNIIKTEPMNKKNRIWKRSLQKDLLALPIHQNSQKDRE